MKKATVFQETYTDYLAQIAEIDFSHESFNQASGQGRSLIRRVIRGGVDKNGTAKAWHILPRTRNAAL